MNLHTYSAITACGAQFDGCVAPSPKAARAMIARRYEGSKSPFIRGKPRSLKGFIVKLRTFDPMKYLLFENAAEIHAVDDSPAAWDHMALAQDDVGFGNS